MPITSLSIMDFRNLVEVSLLPISQGLNIICGQNGSGKTSLLEAIHYLGYGKSFRTSTSTRLIRHETDKFSLFCHMLNTNQTVVPIGVERSMMGGSRMRIDGADAASTAELAGLLPIRVIHSQSHHLFESGPLFRRKFIDWGLFYQSAPFFNVWKQFERALKQRNSALKERAPKREVDIWSEEMARLGVQLDAFRQDYLSAWHPILCELVSELLAISSLEINYYSGWDKTLDYRDVLLNGYIDDMRYGCTQEGPQRADMEIIINGLSAKHFLSRGQQKLLICAMILAQGKLLLGTTNKSPIYLIDDLPAELDENSRNKLFSLLARQHSQVFVTAIEASVIAELLNIHLGASVKVFHVEHGRIGENGLM